MELGCGEGNDSVLFAQAGHTVTATDFSDVVIRQNTERYSNNNLHFAEQDISEPLAFPDQTFDVVYARLSLHYFRDSQTRKIFQEIAHVLKQNGSLYFMCKSTGDRLHGKGTKIEADMFELDGHVRHFFSREYAEAMVKQAGLTIKDVTVGNEEIYGKVSGFVKVHAAKETVKR